MNIHPLPAPLFLSCAFVVSWAFFQARQVVLEARFPAPVKG